MKSKLAILLWVTSSDTPHLCAAPFMYAASAAAMDAEVEIHFAGKSVELLLEGVASKIATSEAETRPIYAFMQDAAGAGVKFLACSHSIAAHLQGQRDFIPEFSDIAGAASFVARVLDPDWTVLSF
ncbi:MAG: DsrE family protein [Burkholderiales bacterium]